MRILQLSFVIFILVLSQPVIAQADSVKKFQGKGFSISYPKAWETSDDDGILNFYPPDNSGAVTISSHSNVSLPISELKSFIVKSTCNEADGMNKVKVLSTGELVEFYYECIEDGTKWIAKVYFKNWKLFFITANCTANAWAEHGKQLEIVFNSFKLD